MSGHRDAIGVTIPKINGAAIARAFDGMAAAARDAARGMESALAPLRRFIERSHARTVEAANTDARVAGLTARFQVRAGLDPAYATPAALDQLVRDVMAGTADPGLRLLTVPNRCLVAAGAVRGWVEAHPGPLPVSVWRGLFGHVTVEVTRA